jgi:serine/threonine-protein kinase
VRRARELGPFSPVASTLEAAFLKRAGRHAESVQRLQEVLQTSEKFWLARITLANVYSELGRFTEALTEAAEARKLSGGSSYAMATEVNALAKLGRHPEAEALLNELLDRSRHRYVPPYDLALAYIGLDDADTALGWLEQGFVQRDPKMTFLSVESRWDTIRTRPEFVDLLRRMNLLEAEERNQLLRGLDRPPQT